jgi:guanine nucleotide-binding protein subunit gamma
MPSGYSSREDPGQMKKNKQSMADLKLRRLTELNTRLREDLDRERIPVSQASKSIITYTNSTKDFMVPSVWGTVDRKDDPYAPQQSGGKSRLYLGSYPRLIHRRLLCYYVKSSESVTGVHGRMGSSLRNTSLKISISAIGRRLSLHYEAVRGRGTMSM